MPYGMRKNSNNEWFVFNWEKMPLGSNINNNTEFYEPPKDAIYTKYKSLTEPMLLKLSGNGENGIRRNVIGEIEWVFFYAITPSNSEQWSDYFEKIKLLSKLEFKTIKKPKP